MRVYTCPNLSLFIKYCQGDPLIKFLPHEILNLSFQTDAPNVTTTTTSYTRSISNDVTLLCAYDANPAATSVTWTKDGQTVDVINSDGKYTGGSVNVPSLTIISLGSDDGGVYVCTVENNQGQGIGSSITLTIECK